MFSNIFFSHEKCMISPLKPGGLRWPAACLCPTSSPPGMRGVTLSFILSPFNLLEELVCKFQPIFKGYFHSSEIYQGRKVIFTAYSHCWSPWQPAQCNAIKHPHVIVNTRGKHWNLKEDNYCLGKEPPRTWWLWCCVTPCSDHPMLGSTGGSKGWAHFLGYFHGSRTRLYTWC